MEGSMFRGIDGLVARRTSRLSGAGTGGVGSFRARFVGDGPSSVAARGSGALASVCASSERFLFSGCDDGGGVCENGDCEKVLGDL